MSTLLLIILIVLLVGGLPSWPYSQGWGYYPSGGLGLVLLVVVVLLLLGPDLKGTHAMNRLAIAACLALAGCTTQQLASPPDQLFCAIQTSGGGTIIAGLIDAEATAMAPSAAPVAILATNMGKAYVDAACGKAAAATGALGAVPVSPPVNPAAAPRVAIVRPAG